MEGNYRLDKWLWAARFFKTRSLATEAINGGKVQLNQQRTTPGRDVKIGDQIRIRREPHEWVVIVQALSERRGPASEAVTLYQETEESRLLREQQSEERRQQAVVTPVSGGRPTKQERRRYDQWLRGEKI